MPRHDPAPRRSGPDYRRAAEAWARYRALMKWMALASAATVLLALLFLRLSGAMSLHMVIATVLGVGLTMLVGTGLMGLVFLSSRSGHDEEAGQSERDGDG